MVDQLRQLVSRFIVGSLDYETFRQQFVEGFFLASDEDRDVSALYHKVESACGAYRHGLLTVRGLRDVLTSLVAPAVTLKLGDGFESRVFQALHASNPTTGEFRLTNARTTLGNTVTDHVRTTFSSLTLVGDGLRDGTYG